MFHRAWRLCAVMTTALLLAGCGSGPSEQERADAYRSAIASVPGVEEVAVDHVEGPSGTSTSIEVFTTASSEAELTEILHGSLQAFLGQVGGDENAHLYFAVHSADEQSVTGPQEIGYAGGSLRELKQNYRPPDPPIG